MVIANWLLIIIATSNGIGAAGRGFARGPERGDVFIYG